MSTEKKPRKQTSDRKERTKAPIKKRITAEMRKDWKTLATADYNVLSFTEYFRGMNAEHYGVSEYLPFHNWRVEQGMIKRALDAHGPVILRAAFDEAFRTYRPTREFPLLTAGFACSYVINGIIPKLKAEQAERERDQAEVAPAEQIDYAAVKKWL